MATRKQKGGGARKRGGWRRTPSVGRGVRVSTAHCACCGTPAPTGKTTRQTGGAWGRCQSCGDLCCPEHLHPCSVCGKLACTRCEVYVGGLASLKLSGSARRSGCRACSNKAG